MRTGAGFFFTLLMAVGAWAAEPATTPPAASSTLPPAAVATYHIGVDDMVQVSVWHNPDLSVTVPVRPDGNISVPLIGDVRAGGRTPEDVAADVKQRLTP